ncbi:MAG: TIM44-like domain-containing protein [Halothiobacillaceae bacterium]
MMLKKIFPFLTALIIGLGLSLQPVEAKRLGTGQDMGQQKQGFAREATPPKAPTSATANTAATGGAAAAGATTAASGASKWMGPLAGLAAGGLLAALFFGGAFEGIQVMDIVLIALLALGIFMVIRMLRAKAAQAQQPEGYQYAAAGGAPYDQAQQTMERIPASGMGFDRSHTPLPDAPVWFDEQGFLQSARKHFLTLQMAWDANDMEKVREYFTPAMFEELRAQRAKIGDAHNSTDVMSLDAQLLDLVREGDKITASVLFQGRVREDQGLPEDFAEIWHVQHAADTAQGDWLISGIQQADPHTLH